MSIPWQQTALSVSPPSIVVADTDRRALRFEAGEPISSATVTATDLGAKTSADEIVEAMSVEADAAVVTIAGLTRGQVVELAVTFERADTTSWTRTLVIRCVA